MDELIQYYQTPLGIIELVASFITILCVFQVTTQSLWNFLWGIIGAGLFGYIFYASNLYADATLQWAYFLPIQLYGVWYWFKGGHEGNNTLKVESLYTEVTTLCFLFILAFGILVGFGYDTYTDAHYPYWDSLILVGSIVAQYLLSRKILDHWFIWIAIDLIAIPLYYVKGLYVTSGLYVVLLCLCIVGLKSWWKEYNDYAVRINAG